ncbi:hypothetical protein [Pseudobdellovibrio sp. HCB154]|uniref:hypothetical protein n=1 Tax=Pseudobdellovibrio sp. HCB154 TaxID=3386277 RepID=UPI0039175DDF
MLKSIFIFVLAFSSSVFADTQEKIVEAFKESKDQVVQALSHSRLVRQNSNYFATGNFAPVDLILPSKFGLTLGVVNDVDCTWELEYLKSSVSVPFLVDDIGEMTDERLSLIRRNYFGTETFNLSYGLSYNRFKMHIGSKYLAYIATNIPDVDLMQIDSLGFNVGIGNRWIFSNRWMVGVDWASWSQPVFTTKYNNKYSDYATDEDSKDTVDTVAKLIRWVPRITLLKLQVGYSF